MKKLNLFTLASLSLSSLAIFSSCRDYDVISEEQMEALTVNKHKIEEFDRHFIERFGEPAKNHAWGQDLAIKPMMIFGGEATRADASGANNNVNVNINQWCQRNNSGYDTNESNLLIDKFQVPGWPNFDGYYYGWKNQSSLEKIVTEAQMFDDNGIKPAGDVTDYEIQFVSTWFRTHQHPKSIDLHLTDFFIQNISCDKDQLTYTGSVDDAFTYSDPTTLGTLSAPGPNGINVRYLSDVIEGSGSGTKKPGVVPNVHRNPNSQNVNSNEELNYSMDYLHFGAVGATFENTLANGNSSGWTHVNNYNNGSTIYDPEYTQTRSMREIKYIYSSGTEDFACRCSWGSDKPWIHDWVLVKLEWIEPAAYCVDGQPHKREGYYLGFDFSGSTQETVIEKDGFYSNWIIKISPAYFTPKSDYSKRVMCEDLGGSFDFDYNDVVFDVAFDGNANEAIISLQAAGGTLPITVGNDVSGAPTGWQEAHNLLGNDVTQPVNVDAGATHEVAIYRVPVSADVKSGKLFAQIPISIKQDGENAITQYVELGATSKSDYQWTPTNPIEPENPGHYNVDKDAKTPLKFVTEVGVKWMKELKGLDYGYNHFWEWVKDPTFLYELNGVKIHWYDAKSNVGLIYKGDETEKTAPTTPVSDPTLGWWQLDVVAVNEDFSNKGLATDIISIDAYRSNVNSIIKKFKNDPNATHITFAYLLKAAPDQSVNAIMLPVWIEGGRPYYKFNDGRAPVEVTESIIRNLNFRESVWQPAFTQTVGNSEGNGYPGQDINGNYTYVSKFSFQLEDMCVKGATSEEDDYCDYVILLIKENIDMTGETLAPVANPPVSKYMVFCMF